MIFGGKSVQLFLCLLLEGCVFGYEYLEEVENLVRQWSPLVWMAPNEKFMPLSAADFLRHVDLADNRGKTIQYYLDTRSLKNDPQLFKSSYLVTRRSLDALKSDKFSFIHGKNPNHYAVPIYALVTNCHQSRPNQSRMENEVFSYVNEARHENANKSLYFHVSYWIFFPYNEGKEVCFLGRVPAPNIFNTCLGHLKTLGNHVGDWEHMSLSFSGRNVPDKLYLSVHNGGVYYTYNENRKYFKFAGQKNRKVGVSAYPPIVRTQGEHPVVFSAYGSHGLWSSPGKHDYLRVPRLTDTNGYGIPWKTWNNIQIYHLGRSELPNWMSFSGKWGNPKKNCLLFEKLGLCEYSDGPEGILREKQDFYCWPT